MAAPAALEAKVTGATPPPRPGKISLEEFMRLPDDGHKYELVNGEVRCLNRPVSERQRG